MVMLSSPMRDHNSEGSLHLFLIWKCCNGDLRDVLCSTQVEQQLFVTRVRPPNFWPLLVWLIINLASLCFAYSLSLKSPYMMLPALVLIFLVPAVWRQRFVRTYVINASQGFYEFYVGNAFIYRGRLRNVYVRLKGTGTGDDTYYCLIVNGFQLEELHITGHTTNVNKLRKLGRRLALNLSINYFDAHDLSAHHVIRHRDDDEGMARDVASSVGPSISPV